jgi:hypothetical protein
MPAPAAGFLNFSPAAPSECAPFYGSIRKNLRQYPYNSDDGLISPSSIPSGYKVKIANPEA